MHTYELLALAIALAMDAFAVALATGVTLRTVTKRQTFRLAWHFGLFQGLMPIIGWLSGLAFRDFIAPVDHWIAFILLAWVGGKMLKEAFEEDEEDKPRKDPTKGMSLVILSIATSIDALAVGLSLSVLGVAVYYPALVIGITALLFTACGLHIGRAMGTSSYVAKYAEVIGGIILLLIGVRILFEHGVFAG